MKKKTFNNKISKISVRKTKMLLAQVEPLYVGNGLDIPLQRKLIWKNICMISKRQCIVEMSQHKQKFYAIALELQFCKFYAVELWHSQAVKII
jgi:hypothetical protein